MRIYVAHARQLGYCLSGIKRMCPSYGVDFRRFLKEGIPVEELEHLKDHHVQKMIDVARKEHGR